MAATPIDFNEIQDWVSQLCRTIDDGAFCDLPMGSIQLQECLATALYPLDIHAFELAPQVCFHAVPADPERFTVRTSWLRFVSYQGHLFGAAGPIALSHATVATRRSAKRWLAPMGPDDYTLRIQKVPLATSSRSADRLSSSGTGGRFIHALQERLAKAQQAGRIQARTAPASASPTKLSRL